MKLEYIADNTASGKYPDAWPTRLIRLFDFDEPQNQQLIKLLSEELIGQQTPIELADVAFISPVNCRLLLRLSPFDKGIIKLGEPNKFACDLTEAGYLTTISIMHSIDIGYNWLTNDSVEAIEFLYSAGGAW